MITASTSFSFNNSSGTQTTTPTSVGTRVVTRSAAGGFNLGLDKSSGTASSFAFATNVFTTNDTIFIVGSYTFNSGSSTDDFSQMWINPPASSFGLASAPPPTLTNIAGGNISQIASFVLFNRNANEPAVVFADEVRVGTSWASVTPPAENQILPSLAITQSPSTSVLSWPTNAPGFVLESSGAVSDPNSWATVPSFIYVIGDQFGVTKATTAGPTFYRLRKPQ